MVKTRTQEDDPKGKAVDTDESEPQWFSRFRETNDQRFSQLEAMVAELYAERKQTNPRSDDRSTIDRSTSPLVKVKGDGSDHFGRYGDDRRFGGDDRRFGGGQSREGGQQTYGKLTRSTKLEFPKFDGNNLKGWVFKAEQFFGLDFTPPELKVQIASVHFDGFAAEWHENFIKSDVGMSVVNDWKSYVQFLRDMFEDEEEDPMAELKNLQETDGIRDYHRKFENIRTRLKLPEDYLVSVYLAGLRTDTRMHVKMFQPQTVRHCYFLGKTYEKGVPKPPVTANWSSKSVGSGDYTRGQKEKSAEPVKVTPKSNLQPTKKLTPQEMDDKKSKGLCYFCDEKYTPEHFATAHKKPQLFCIAGVDDEFEDAEEELSDEEEIIANALKPMPIISVNAVSGVSDYCTMRVKGTYDKKPVFVLIDSGSTHNFLDTEVAVKLGCKIDKAGLTQVSVADGRRLTVDGRIKGFQWNFQHTTFESDVLLIPLKGNDMVLGVQWLVTLGKIDWEFKKLEMSFKYKNKKVSLQGIKTGSVRDVKAQKLLKLPENHVQLAMLCVQDVTGEEELEGICTLNALQVEGSGGSVTDKLLTGFSEVFAKEPELVLERKLVKRQGKAIIKVLVKWLNEPLEEATWELLFALQQQYPSFVA